MSNFFENLAKKIVGAFSKTGLEQELNAKAHVQGNIPYEEIKGIARLAAAEGMVLLKNKGALPLKKEESVAVFGRCAINYFVVGYGSGGDVSAPYKVNLIDGLKNVGAKLDEELLAVYEKWCAIPKNVPPEAEWGKWPMNFPEMPLEEETVKNAAQKSDTALVVIGRAAGEDRENTLKEGSYYLTKTEIKMLDAVTEEFKNVVVVMDCGNIIDMAWLDVYGNKINAVLYAWHGGMEAGNATADVLTGAVNPAGRLSDTIAKSYEALPSANNFGNKSFNNYAEDIYVGYRYFESFAPEDVMFPFGFGLSYTSFDVHAKAAVNGTNITVTAEVENTGKMAGNEVVQLYVSAPQGALGKAEKVLAGFAKTGLIMPGKSQSVEISFDLKQLASFDDSGASGFEHAYVLEAGEYVIYAGQSVRDAKALLSHRLEETMLVEQLKDQLMPQKENAFERMINKNGKPVFEHVPHATKDLRREILNALPKQLNFEGDKGYKFSDVEKGDCTLEEFVAQLTPKELDDISCGEGKMDSALGTAGNAGAFGGVSNQLRAREIPPVITTDGPAGVRLNKVTSLLPCGTALACSFNVPLVEELYVAVGRELEFYGSNMLLAPGMNIHRDPLCGRNFEYFSEDPLLSGKMGAAVVRGLQSRGVSACPKHFACNNQEYARSVNDSRVSARALREIYLKGFEIMVKESRPLAIMTSYNKINGVWCHYGYELATNILRKEWGFDGLVITDWWMQAAFSPEFSELENDAYRVRAQVDVFMPGGDGYSAATCVGKKLLDSYGMPNGITLPEMQRVATNVLKFILRLNKLKAEVIEEK